MSRGSKDRSSGSTVFAEVALYSQGSSIPKNLSDGTIMVDSKHLYVGANANWMFSWKNVEEVIVCEPRSMMVRFSDKTSIECVDGDPASFRPFHDLILKRWNKIQSKNEADVEPAVVTTVRRPKKAGRRTYGKSSVRSKPRMSMVQPTYFSSDDEKEAPKEVWREPEEIEDVPSADEKDNMSDTSSALHEASDEFEMPRKRKVQSRSEKLTKTKRRLQKFEAGRSDDIEDSEDEEIFGDPVLTTPAAQRIVSPANATSDGEEESAPPPTSAKGNPSIASFFTAKSLIKTNDRRARSPMRTKTLVAPATPTRPLKKDVEWLSSPSPSTPRRRKMDTLTKDDDTDVESISATPPPKESFSTFFTKKRTFSERDSIEGTPPPPANRKRFFPASSKLRHMNLNGKTIRSPFTKTSLADAALCISTPKKAPNNPYNKIRQVDEEGPKCPWKGLRNLGNTCYLNSSLQMLYSIRGFVSSLAGKGADLANSIVGVADSLKDSTFSANPKAVKQAIDAVTDKFVGYEQRDAHEFLSDLVDQVHDELENEVNATNEKESGNCPLPTDEYFRMNVQACLTCDSCGYTRTMEEMYRHLSLDIEDHTPSAEGDNDTPSPWSIQRGIDQFFKPEKRELKCEKCEEGTSATQTLRILSSPKALLLHLKRFVMVEKPVLRAPPSDEKEGEDSTEDKEESTRPVAVEMTFRKNKAPVSIQPTISLGPIVGADQDDEAEMENGAAMASYDLKSVVHHIGGTAASGHYTADAIRVDESKPQNSETWVSFDDGRTSVTSADQVLHNDKSQRTAYMLLYTLHQ